MVHLLFVCVENACRSQMAEGFARHIAGDEVSVSSGGSRPASEVNPDAIRVMEEKGIDISSQKPTSINTEDSESADFVISMGCGSEACPAPLGGKNIEWDVEDPSGKSVENFREVRDEIEKRVENLLNEILEE